MKQIKPYVTAIIPVYNEERHISQCLESLKNRTYKPIEIIIVDDSSNDKTCQKVKKFHVKLIKQNHKGPGPARNLGASQAHGKILVFVDADMTFDKKFISDLTIPILRNKTIGTFSKNEKVSNYDNLWSICWNINRNVPKDRMLPINYPNEAPVFRAILKKEFDKVSGFDTSGEYTDDWSLSRKLGIKSTLAKGAVYYHLNPSTLQEVFKQARWIGKNEFISGSFIRKIRSLIFYSLPLSLFVGLFKSVVKVNFYFLIFKIIYDLGVFVSVVKSFFKEPKFK